MPDYLDNIVQAHRLADTLHDMLSAMRADANDTLAEIDRLVGDYAIQSGESYEPHVFKAMAALERAKSAKDTYIDELEDVAGHLAEAKREARAADQFASDRRYP